MIAAVVTGNVWSTRHLEGLPNGALLEVEIPGSGSKLIAFDVLGCGVGEHVLIAQGSVAANWFTGPPPPVDALVIGSIDQRSSSNAATAAASEVPLPNTSGQPGQS
jgi:ethanolamine utilization protein EutN